MTRVSTPRRPSTWYLWVPLLVVLLVVGLWFVTSNRSTQGEPGPPGPPGASATPTSTTTSSMLPSPRASTSPSPSTSTSTSPNPSASTGSTPESGLPTIAESALPRPAKQTLALIRAGGPYPHRQDDGVFGNREQVLPQRSNGYYREYTVTTPGENDRGPRRIVAGHDGDLYWTTDHYASFRQILEGT